MRTKERKKLAQKIAACELIIERSTDTNEIKRAQDQIIALSGCVDNIEDMMAIDELVQDIIANS